MNPRGSVFSAAYALAFFTFLFGPLIIMVITAFNSSRFPRVTPWECFTTGWFNVLITNDRLMSGLLSSLFIGIGVIVVAVPVGLAGALALSELSARLRATLYTVLIVPILIPGVVLGISTIVFWGQIGRTLGGPAQAFFYNGYFLTIAGQVTFISAYAMLVFIARLQRFDATQTEAALDLGASPGQAFRKILLPFLAPAIGSAAFITLLASFENYNTTVFTILSGNTFTTALASKVRHGTDPSLSALAVIIISITLIGALTHEAYIRRKTLLDSGKAEQSAIFGNPVLRLLTHPGAVLALLLCIAGGLVWLGSKHDSSVCEAGILEEKRAIQRQLQEEQRSRIDAQKKAGGQTQAPAEGGAGNPSPFGGAFTGGLAPESAAPEPAAPSNPSPFGGAFNPGTLAPAPE
jgi:spermidine/putrescine transport system permease protein|tara:strand:- start:1413 stop:2633 length:1221 start_codon:yes stop_codon:yes gene_type:complete